MRTNYRCNNSMLSIIQGNIIDSNSDVIASSDNAGLQMSQGVSRAIYQAGGNSIDTDLSKIHSADIGDVIVSTAGNLPQKYIFHCIADKRGSQRGNDLLPIIIGQTLTKAFQLMPMLGLSSIAFPAIGTGAIGLDMDVVAKAMIETIVASLMKTNRTITVELFLLGRDDYHLFCNVAESFSDLKIYGETDIVNLRKESGSYDLFISYCWKDQDFALDLCSKLDSLKLNYFIDRRRINGGDDHKETIIKALKNTKMVLFLSSKDSNQSIYVKQEIANATEMRIPVIPLRVDMSPYADSILFDFVNSLYIDCSNGLAPKWDELRRYLIVKGIVSQDNL